MEKLNLFSLKMKFKRHKLPFEISNNGNTIKLGGSNISISKWLTLVVLPFTAGAIFIFFWLLDFIDGFAPILINTPILYGIFGIAMIRNKKNDNKNIKIISQGHITIIENEHKKVFNTDNTKEILPSIDTINDISYEGLLFLIDNNNKKHKLLSILDKEEKYIKNDLIYFKDYFDMMLKKAIQVETI